MRQAIQNLLIGRDAPYSMTPKSNTSNNLVEGSVRQSLIRMTLPMILGMLILFTFSVVDTWFISFLGTESLAAISFTFPVTFTVTSLAIGLGIGAAAVVGKCLGSSKIDEAKQAATVINYISFGLAAMLATCLWWFMEPIFSLMGAEQALYGEISSYMNVWFPGSVLVDVSCPATACYELAGTPRLQAS